MTIQAFKNKIVQNGTPLLIDNIELTSDLHLQQNLIATGVIIKNCTFKRNVLFDTIDLSYGVRFIDCTFEENLIFKNCFANTAYSDFNSNNCNIEFQGVTIKNLFFHNWNKIPRGVQINASSNIDVLEVSKFQSNMGSFGINKSVINHRLDFRQVLVKGNLSVGDHSEIHGKTRVENVKCDSFVFTESTFKQRLIPNSAFFT